MAWYKQGTITLQSGSNVVLGLGTSWLSDVIPGEGLDAPDGRIYEISEVINNTELRLVDVFVGESIVGAGYQVIPNASMTKDLTRRVNALLAVHEKSTAEVLQAAGQAVGNAAAAADTADKAAERAAEKAKAAADSADQAEVSEKSAALSKASSAADSDRAMAYRNEARYARDAALEHKNDAASSAASASSNKSASEDARDAARGYAESINPALIQAALQGMRNKIINGAFQINQDELTGTVTLAAGVYGHDRWKAGASGCTYTFATVAGITTITITAGTLCQVIEGVNLQSGSYVLGWEGTAQGRVDAGAYGVSGAVVGVAVGGINQTVEFGTGTVRLVQYERGATKTQFEFRHLALEFDLCARYYEVIGGTANQRIAVGQATSSSNAEYLLSYRRKRATPTLSLNGVLQISGSGFGLLPFPSHSFSSIGIDSCSLAVSGVTGLAAGNASFLLTVNAGSRVKVKAEL